MDIQILQLIWYVVFIVAMFAYAALDGFDIGVGCLHLFSSTDKERRYFINAIGPVWDSNSLWVIITGGALLAGFPKAFATLFGSFFIPLNILVIGYILRAAAVEFRGKMESQRWRNIWDRVFAVASYMLGFGFGFVLANLLQGLPINENEELQGSFLDMISPYSIGLGFFTTIMFMIHGALFLNMKLEGSLQQKVQGWTNNILYPLFLTAWISITMATLVFEPKVTQLMRDAPWLFAVEILGVAGIVLIPKFMNAKREGFAFISSTLVIASMVINYAVGTFPAIIRSTIDPVNNSLTIYNSSSSQLTLQILIGIALVGVPLFILYCAYAFRIFRGKVELDSMSY